MSTTMRAKFVVSSVSVNRDADGKTTSETVAFNAVAKSGGYPEDGTDEDNTFAKWSPSASLSITFTNPALFDKYKVGQKHYADFSPAD